MKASIALIATTCIAAMACTSELSSPDPSSAVDAGTIDLARRIAVALNAGGKTPMFSNVGSFVNPKGEGAPFWLDENRLLDGLAGTTFQFNYESVRAEKLHASGMLANMLGGAPELERELLPALVNKLGDPEKKVAK